jgi:hypothetical protein
VTEAGDLAALVRLEPEARARLELFAHALSRVPVDDLPLYVGRRRQQRHRRAAERAEVVAVEHHVMTELQAVRSELIDALMRRLVDEQFRVWVAGAMIAPDLLEVDQRIRVAESVGGAVTALVLGEQLAAADRFELLGAWARLLP